MPINNLSAEQQQAFWIAEASIGPFTEEITLVGNSHYWKKELDWNNPSQTAKYLEVEIIIKEWQHGEESD